MIRLEKRLDAGEGHVTIIPIKPNSIPQGDWLIYTDTGMCLNFIGRNNSSTDGDNSIHKVFLNAGTYTLNVIYRKGANGGIVDFDIDGVEVGSADTYNVATARNFTLNVTGINIPTSGIKDFRIRADGHNIASGGYLCEISMIQFIRTV